MKTRDLEHMLIQHGFSLVRQNKHNVWQYGKMCLTVPMHKEINPFLAKKIIKQMWNIIDSQRIQVAA